MFAKYQQTRGSLPSQDVEPTAEQLSAVAQLVNSGAPPYVDFSIFGPHGRRLLRKLTFVSYTYQAATGEYRRIELPGPPSFETWWKSYIVLRCCLLLLECVLPERPEAYGELIRGLSEKYALECWSIVY